jgi:anti-anti-sigma regulatory factor
MADEVYRLQNHEGFQCVTLTRNRYDQPAHCRALSRLLEQCILEGVPADVLINFGTVTFMSEVCLSVLRTLGDDCNAHHGHLGLYGVDLPIRMALEATGCTPEFMTVHDTLDEARTHFRC